MATPAVVLLDLDGTLLDHRGSVHRALDAWLGGQGLELTGSFERAWFAAEREHLPAWRDGRVSFAEQRRRRLRDVLPLLGLPVGTDAELDDVFAGYADAYAAAWEAFDDVDEAVTDLHRRGVRTAVLTNGTTQQQTAKLAAVGLDGRLGPVFTAEALGVAKPHRLAFERTCGRLGVAPADVVYVGDDHEVDVLAARAAGLRAVHVDRDGAGTPTERDRVTTLADLPDVLWRSTAGDRA